MRDQEVIDAADERGVVMFGHPTSAMGSLSLLDLGRRTAAPIFSRGNRLRNFPRGVRFGNVRTSARARGRWPGGRSLKPA